jgi:hypothetical protein
MTFPATVVRILIASPGDTGTARVVLRNVIEEWNSLNAEDTGVILLPVMWERDATPEMGDRPQGIINRQLVDVSDVLIGTFWTRLGTPTSEAESGTAEEIERFMRDEKPVLIYFSNQPVVLGSVDVKEYERLTAFRDTLKERGLFDEYSTEDELWRKVSAALTRTIRERFRVEGPIAIPGKSRPRASLLAHVEREREVSGFNNRGAPQYRTRTALIIDNNGTAAAEDFSFHFESASEGVSDRQLPQVYGEEAPVKRFAPGGSLRYPLSVSMATVDQCEIVMRWREGDTEREESQTLRI